MSDDTDMDTFDALQAEMEAENACHDWKHTNRRGADSMSATKTKSALFDLSSIGVAVEKPRQLTDKFSAILYAHKGVGKTSFLGSCADVEALGPVLILGTEDGTSVLSRDYSDDPNLDVVNVEDWSTAAEIITAVANHETKYKTVAIDTLSELQEIMKRFRTKDGQRDMEFKDWAFVADNTINIVKMLHRSPYVNVIFTTHAEKVKDEDSGKLLLSPYFLGKKSLTEALKPVDEVWYLAVSKNEKGESVRVLQTQPDGKIDASDRSGKLDFYIESPNMAEVFAQLSK